MRSLPVVVIALGAFAACRSDNKGKADASSDAAPTLTIQVVQSDAIAPGSPVALSGVIVTAIDSYGAKTGDLWVEEPEGGPYSGVHIYKADPTAVMGLTVGDKVDVSNAVKASFALATDMTGRTETELEPPATGGNVTVTKTGTGTVPGPDMVNALSIGMMDDANKNGARSAAWRMWDGVLIKVTDVTQTSSVADIGGKTPDPTLQKFGITGGALVESSLSAFPSGIGFNSCLGSVTGVLSYFFDYQILQRNTGDIVTGGSSCPAPENSDALCGDGMDNDGNTYSDCSDNNCIILSPLSDTLCRNITTISAVDSAADAAADGTTPPTLPAGKPVGVQLGNGTNADVYVTAISIDKKNVWVATAKAGASDGGLDVYNPSGTLDAGVVVGAKVNVIGKLSAYNNDTQGATLPELEALQINVSGAPTGTAPSGSTQTAANLTVTATGRPYVGSLVTLSNVKIVSAPDPANHMIASLQQATTMFEAEADVHVLTSAVNTCFLSITGVWTYDVYNNKYAFEPTGEGTGTGTCP